MRERISTFIEHLSSSHSPGAVMLQKDMISRIRCVGLHVTRNAVRDGLWESILNEEKGFAKHTKEEKIPQVTKVRLTKRWKSSAKIIQKKTQLVIWRAVSWGATSKYSMTSALFGVSPPSPTLVPYTHGDGSVCSVVCYGEDPAFMVIFTLWCNSLPFT